MTHAIAVLILAVSAAADPAPAQAAGGGLPTEVVVHGEGGKLSDAKPALKIAGDPFETIRADLVPDPNLLLASSPLTVSWRRTHPEFLMNERVVQPWRGAFSDRPGIPFRVREQLESALGAKLSDREARGWRWSLSIADEQGRVFHHYGGSGDPPVELVWSGQNEQGDWMTAGRSYSPVYGFTGPDNSQHTRVGAPLLFKGVVHQEDTGLHVTLDSAALFGANKSASTAQPPAGADLLRSAADLIKRRYSGIPIAVRVYAKTPELGKTQAAAVQSYLLRELMVGPRYVTAEAEAAPFSDQRVEVVLLNR